MEFKNAHSRDASEGGFINVKHLLFFLLFISPLFPFSQGLNNLWLLGYREIGDTYTSSGKAIIDFSSGSADVQQHVRKMHFQETEGNISGSNGNLLMSSNGVWIANAAGDTMLNGSGLNPNSFTSSYSPYGIPLPYGNVFLPYPGDSTKYLLFHLTGNYNITNAMSTELFYSVIDMTKDGGLGKVILKNQTAISDTLRGGIGVCRHANGRDWWIVVVKDSTDIIYKILFTPSGIQSITTQSFGVPLPMVNWTQPTFSPDGTKFAYCNTWHTTSWIFKVRMMDFDRCSGVFSNPLYLDCSDTHPGLGVAFSPNSKYLYAASTYHIFQINTDTSNIAASLDTVSANDGYYSPVSPYQTNFWLLYLAADGKIYSSTGNGTNALHFINYPDSDGMACDVQQHALHLPCYNVGTVPNHPNYFLGCDTASGCPCLATNINEMQHDFPFSIYPNPITNQQLKISYLLPQNKKGMFEIYDVNGRKIFSYALPQWSTMQYFSLPELSSGIYNCIITSGSERVSRKVAVVRE
jgi:hypothetical protein